jgi:hypothetical protein
MGARVSDDVGGCPSDGDFRRILVEACRSESDDVGVGWGKDWGKRSRLNLHLLAYGAGDQGEARQATQVFRRSEWKSVLGSSPRTSSFGITLLG